MAMTLLSHTLCTRVFRTLYAHRVEGVGYITSVWFFRDRGRIEYSYMCEGKTYNSYAAVMKTAHTIPAA